MEESWARRYSEKVVKSHFTESYEEFREDCTHAEICFEYKGRDYFVDCTGARYSLLDAHENLVRRRPHRIFESDTIDGLLEAPSLDGRSIRERYGEIRPYVEVFPGAGLD